MRYESGGPETAAIRLKFRHSFSIAYTQASESATTYPTDIPTPAGRRASGLVETRLLRRSGCRLNLTPASRGSESSPRAHRASSVVCAFTVNLTAKQLYFRLARIKDCAAIRRPPPQPDILDDVLGLRRASENAVLESGAAFGYYVRGMGVHPVRRIPKIPGAHSKNTWIS